MTNEEIKKELEVRGITIQEASDMFGIAVFMNWQNPKMPEIIFDMLAHKDYELAKCNQCGKDVCLDRYKNTEGYYVYRLREKGSVWLDNYKYCGICGPKILEEAMVKQERQLENRECVKQNYKS